MAIPKHKRNKDQTYGPTTKNHYYVSVEYHRKTASKNSDKTKWCIEEGQEFSVFKPADENNWHSESENCLFGFYLDEDKKLEILGTDGEVVAKFPKPNTEKETWHGYPVKTAETQNRPSSELLDEMDIPHRYRIKIEKGTI